MDVRHYDDFAGDVKGIFERLFADFKIVVAEYSGIY